MKKQCPLCGNAVKVIDPYKNSEIKRASAYFATHKDWRTGKKCSGSLLTAIARECRPASDDPKSIDV